MATSTGSFTNLVLTQNPFVGFPKGSSGGFLSKAIEEQISLSSFDNLNATSKLLAAMKCLPKIDEISAKKAIDSINADLPNAKLFAVEGNSTDILEILCQCVTSDVQSRLKAIVFNPELFPFGARLKLVIEYESELGYLHWLFCIGDDKFIFLGHIESKIIQNQPSSNDVKGLNEDSYKEEIQSAHLAEALQLRPKIMMGLSSLSARYSRLMGESFITTVSLD
jgi:hypothetical protein